MQTVGEIGWICGVDKRVPRSHIERSGIERAEKVIQKGFGPEVRVLSLPKGKHLSGGDNGFDTWFEFLQ